MRYFLRLSYDGGPFRGWQVQPGEQTVQGVLEDALGKLLRRPTGVTGAGRTDTGVNARMMIAHFDTDTEISDPVMLVYRLNAIVGPAIAVEAVWRVADDAHARFDATSRTYRYFVSTRKSPFLNGYTWRACGLDFDAMQRAAALLVGRRDYTSFSKLHTQVKTNICDIRDARWVQMPGVDGIDTGVWYFEITADRFLRNMVRAVVGTLVEVGRGKISPEDVTAIIERRDRGCAGTSMPGHALFLWEVGYEK